MQSRNLNEWLETMPGLKTQKGAQVRLDKVKGALEEFGSPHMIYRKLDGTFVPLVFCRANDSNVGFYAHNGICVTN